MSSSTPELPANVHVSQHPCLRAKLSQLRSQSTPAKEVKTLVHDIALMVAYEALGASTKATDGSKDSTPLGFDFTSTTISPSSLCLVPILRSGLGMVEAVQTILPTPVAVHHLGLYREPSTLEPVEYYNNLPNHVSPDGSNAGASELAIVLDPVIATGGTCAAAIQTLREWGVKRIVVLSVIGAAEGVKRAASEWADATDIYIAGVDAELTDKGMLKPGVGDVGDRLFLTIGK
ncbi:uracil phosphoribosyltransferase [Colletotrichum abscissum]|uniref:uracil phosphoribosyltransferase n=5 Tax=Colletotrichum acutatum species complex TaxID=2707335 RepID=A0A9P9X4D9_9PEZI|nr:uracil phosphoribosyltransferase [Colletotrichum tamarilloi]XP_060400598.1 uracil phosphoribosyltransferase [Colletotrichum abscissum]KAI3527300.1 uracil phosphoribosyltransferase [Colletotrichum filicis]KAK0373923.1 uracil phosphoribosyltransferase [Colletotrichum limetticola]KAK1466108.1 uracil phosphoribosyltransferase [Colletotrichum cuscutae]KAK1467099.1 uracil phosphoribosyltransferase [Colletotrichum melonis]KAK1701685.1 uracil phosphoribosyltransferase [Colletotrichum lupini]